MKTFAKLMTLVLLSTPTATWAQKNIEGMFDTFRNTKGINVSVSNNMQRDDAGHIEEETVELSMLVGKQNFGLFEKLQKAFEADGAQATTCYTCFNPVTGSNRQLWAIKTRQGSEFRIGEKANSSYAIITFTDKENPKRRTVYAAEWWNTDDANIKQGLLVRSYGDKPSMASARSSVFPWDLGQLRKGLKNLDMDSIRNSLLDSRVIGDSRVISRLEATPGIFDGVLSGMLTDDKPLDLGDNVDEWMAKAKQRMSHLSNADWHRFFGLITTRIDDYVSGNKKADKDACIIYAGLVMDLVNNSSRLSEEEKALSSRRLWDVINKIDGDSNEYFRSLLVVAANKLGK